MPNEISGSPQVHHPNSVSLSSQPRSGWRATARDTFVSAASFFNVGIVEKPENKDEPKPIQSRDIQVLADPDGISLDIGEELDTSSDSEVKVEGQVTLGNVTEFMPPVLKHVAKLFKVVESFLDTQGLYRLSAVKGELESAKDEVKSKIENLSFAERPILAAATAKSIIGDIPTEERMFNGKDFSGIEDYDNMTLEQAQGVISQLTDQDKKLLEVIVKHGSKVASHSDKNLMTPYNLGVCFAPNLFNSGTFEYMNKSDSYAKFVGYLIENHEKLDFS